MTIYKEALTFRKPISLSLWKEYNQFESFVENLHRKMPTNWKLRESPVKAGAVKKFLMKPWQGLRKVLKKDEDRLLDWRRALIERFEKELRKIDEVKHYSLLPIVRCNDWHLFGELGRLEVLDRKGDPEVIKKSSPILDKLSGLPDNVPFLVFFLGSEKSISELKKLQGKKNKQRWERFESKIADSLMTTIKFIAEDKKNKQWSAPLVECLINLNDAEKEDDR